MKKYAQLQNRVNFLRRKHNQCCTNKYFNAWQAAAKALYDFKEKHQLDEKHYSKVT